MGNCRQRYGVEARMFGVGAWKLVWGYGSHAQAEAYENDCYGAETRIVLGPRIDCSDCPDIGMCEAFAEAYEGEGASR